MKYQKKSAKRVYKKKSVGKKHVSLAIKKYVKRTIHSNLEKKISTFYGANLSINSQTAQNNFQSIVPQLSQGTNDSQRIGNQVNITKGMIHGYVNILPYNATSNTLSTAVMVKIWICKYKKTNQASFATAYNTNTDFFDVGSTNIGFQSNMLDMVLTCNKDDWIWYNTKTFKIGASNATASGQVGSGGYYDNSPMTHAFSFNFGKHLKKLHFNDTDVIPTNTNLFIVFQAVYADGSSSALNPAEYHFVSRVEYEDA